MPSLTNAARDHAGEPPPNLSLLQAFRFAASDRAHVERLLSWAEFPRDAAIVDLGAGAGFVASGMHERRPDLSFCLVDKDRQQLERAKPAFRKHCADICGVPEPDDGFDGLLCCYAAGYAAADSFFGEAHRLVRPGGVVFIVDMIPKSAAAEPQSLFGYSVRGRAAMEGAAAEAGLELDFYLEPVDRSGWGEALFPGYFHIFFGDVQPAIWRFRVPSPKRKS